MKRPSREDSLAGGEMIPVFPSTREVKGVVYRRVGSFQSMLDGLGEEEEVMEGGDEDMCSQGVASGGAVGLGSAEKKRRLSVEQVKALEKNFEVENKLEPERKVKLAQELGLQPRQVAVWFQNRRARWKTKQLERDFGVLKANYDALKLNYDALHHDKEVLLAEIEELRAKLAADGDSSYCSIKEEPRTVEESLENTKKNEAEQGVVDDNGEEDEEEEDKEPPALIYKDGSSDSDSSAILNDENSPHHLGSAVISSSSGIPSHHHQLLEESHHHHQQQPLFATLNYTSTFASSPAFQCPEGKSAGGRFGFLCSSFQPQLRAEERGFLGGDESCSAAFLSDEQLPWYCAADQWN